MIAMLLFAAAARNCPNDCACTKAPMLRVPDKLSGWHSQDLLISRLSTISIPAQRRNAPAQFVYDIVEMTDCILEAINSSTQAYISALTGRLCPSISSLDCVGRTTTWPGLHAEGALG